MMQRAIWIGHDRREETAFRVARSSLLRRVSESIPVHALRLEDLQRRGLYTRPTTFRDGRLIDLLSRRDEYDGSLSTDHAIARFLVPTLSPRGWALFLDGDTLTMSDIARVFANLDPAKAVYCVQHQHVPVGTAKMDAQVQTAYARKNWSSFMIFNCEHRSNRRLTGELVNSVPGRDLHRFCWLRDDEIGCLDQSWNFLVGTSDPEVVPDVVHFTDGTPDMPGYENVPYADVWRAELKQRAA